jgi:catechol 2,3-dioxygenase
MATGTRPHLAHLGIYVWDLDVQESFYTSVFDLLVTDRGVGPHFGNRLIFLSGSPDQHHQLVLSSGREERTASTIMQLSFKVDSLDALRRTRDSGLRHGATGMIALNHGNAWSVYFFDPEGNRIEVYLDTPFHTPQPCGASLDLDQSDDVILSATAQLVQDMAGTMPREMYVEQMRERLSTRRP